MSTRLYVAAIHGSNEQGKYCSSSSAAIGSIIEPRYKLSTLHFLPFTVSRDDVTKADGRPNGYVIAAIVIACIAGVVVLIFVIILIIILVKKNQRQRQQSGAYMIFVCI